MGNTCKCFRPVNGEGAYKIVREIGEGSYAIVYLAWRYSDNQMFAIKKSK
jgi:hypothetical protein